ncbi:FkbM family methyltransferase [Algibacter sp. AS12]|uniref:FkbM family methyltransferase n=1 Tax=Algibacter sp. AS12 TaxID=3135773 RepID=UPI00398AC1B1
MKKYQRKLINRIINKLYVITNSDKIRLFCLNIATKLFKNPKNSIKFDSTNNWYWLKSNSKFLKLTREPYFDFSEKEMRQRCFNIFFKHYHLEPGNVVIAIGAGIGMEVCFFEEGIGDKGKLYNIEASPSSFYGLQQTTLKNGFQNCFNYNLAISDSNEPLWMEEENNYILNSINKDGKGVKVEALTLDEFVIINNIDKIDLLKVNIEGAEYEMIDGMKESVKRIENIAVSCHDFLFDSEDKIKNKMVTFLEAHNFQLFYVNSGNKVLDSWIYGKKQYQ